ncbi:MAG: biotin synthase BioB [Coxiella sp. RIFCSPHIGHO2_12_FULL_42_15]|nr:MAG: biotin synthase BioB [Coxiella sp. RIFCSPHIGHO2_12_FULL_42_15]
MTEALHHDWTPSQIAVLFDLPFNDLLWQAHGTHRQYFPANEVQVSTLLSIKTGACPEDCAYCPQSGHYHTGLSKEKLMELNAIVEKAREAKASGATRFCMGAAWRHLPKKEMPKIAEIVKEVKSLGLETCMTLGMLTEEQAQELHAAGLDYYNHNIDTSPEYYEKIITTRCFQDRIDTLAHVRHAGIKVCCGGIVGLGETRMDRIEFLRALANLPEHPESVPINRLVSVQGTPLEKQLPLDNLEFIRTIAVARIIMPKSVVRLSAGREKMSDEMQALCFFAGANSIFYGEKLLTTKNPECERDVQLFQKLGINQKGYDVAPV